MGAVPHEASAAPGSLAVTQHSSAKDTSVPRLPKRFVQQQVPAEILNNEDLNAAVSILPANYNFEVYKTVWRLRQAQAQRVALQFPEGLLMYACIISDILERFAAVEQCFILGDVTYGACCIDDFSARALGAEFLVHYGHSCLVPVDVTGMPCLYVFVDIGIDVTHLVETLRLNFQAGSKLALAGTIQFAGSIQAARQQLATAFPSLGVPQAKPLSPGEVLGCTAPPVAKDTDAIVFVADGRFHLEAIMIANPQTPAFRYDPYARVLLREQYDHSGMLRVRRSMVMRAQSGQQWGVVLGTLGRQGNSATFDRLCALLEQHSIPHVLVLLSEVTPQKLDMLPEVDVWVQVACPRLSIDWGEGFSKPTLTPYEALVALGEVMPFWDASADLQACHNKGCRDHCNCDCQDNVQAQTEGSWSQYPMDYYARDGGVWNSSHHKQGRLPASPLVGLQARISRNRLQSAV